MKILLASDFYYEYELYETNDPEALKSWMRDMMNGRFSKMDETKHKLLGSQDDLDLEEAQAAADEIISDSEMYDD